MIRYSSSEYINEHENIAVLKMLAHEREDEHVHEFIELVYIWTGFGIHVVNDVPIEVEKGDLLFLQPGDRHAFRSTGAMGIVNILLEPSFISERLVNADNATDFFSLRLFGDFNGLVTTPCVRFRGKTLLETDELVERMVTEFERKRPGYRTILHGCVQILLTEAFRLMRATDDENEHWYPEMHRAATEILAYLKANYAERITLSDLAAKSFYSSAYLGRIFKECYGVTVTEYVQELRMKEAALLMRTTSDSVDLIGRRVGFQDKKRFYKRFKETFGQTPLQMRKAHAARTGKAPTK